MVEKAAMCLFQDPKHQENISHSPHLAIDMYGWKIEDILISRDLLLQRVSNQDQNQVNDIRKGTTTQQQEILCLSLLVATSLSQDHQPLRISFLGPSPVTDISVKEKSVKKDKNKGRMATSQGLSLQRTLSQGRSQ